MTMNFIRHFDTAEEARAFVDKYTVKLLRPIGRQKATLRLLEIPNAPAPQIVCKDFLDVPAWYRTTIGRFLIGHEYGAYARMQGMKGVPQIYGRPYSSMMLMEYLHPGDDLWKYEPGQIPPIAFAQLREILLQMHQRGVLHLDLGHDCHRRFGRETNLIWHEGKQQLYIMDLGGALYGIPLPCSVWAGLALHDYLVLTKIHDRFFPDMEYQAPPPLPKWALKLFTFFKKI